MIASEGKNLKNVSVNDNSCNEVTEQFLGMLFPYILEAIKEYYGENRAFTNVKLLELKTTELGQYSFEAKVQVITFVGAHNPPFGLDTITLRKDLSEITVINFEHQIYKFD